MKHLKKIKVSLQNIINLISEIQINHEIVPIALDSFNINIFIEFKPKEDFFKIKINKNLNINFSTDLSYFLSDFPNLNMILLENKKDNIIETQKKLKINTELKKIEKILFKKIQKLHPDIPPLDNIICDLLYSNYNIKSNELRYIDNLKKDFQTVSEKNNKKSFENILKNIKKITEELNIIILRKKKIEEQNNNLKKLRMKIINKLEDTIFEKLYDKLFPIRQSEEDKKIYKQCIKLSWIEPNHLFEKKKYLIHKDFFTDIIYLMRQTDIERAPKKKIKALNQLILYVNNIIALNEGNNEYGTEELTPFLLYAIIKAKPIKMYSNLEYIKLYVENIYLFPNFLLINGIVDQLLKDKYKLYNISHYDIINKSNEALQNYIDV
jgi:hypothetical protein